MAAIKILVVEDDLLIAEEIGNVLQKAGYRVIAVVDTCSGALEAAKKEAPDLVFMDIKIGGDIDGIETAKRLKSLGDFPLIFLTNLHDKPTLQRAMRVNPANYLAKPFTPQQLLVSIQHALLNFSENRPASIQSQAAPVNEIISFPDRVFIKDKEGNFKMEEIAHILYIEADRSYCTIHTQNEKYVQASSMTHIHEKMKHPHLIQISRSHVVNLNRIERIKGNVVVINGTEIKIGGQYRERFLKQVNLVR